MSVLLIVIAIVAIGFLCWLVFTLAIYVLPVYAGIAFAQWAWHYDAGLFGTFMAGLAVAAVTFGMGQFLIIVIPWLWARLAVGLLFVAPAAIAGFHATHGIVVHIAPSEVWQLAFSIGGAVVVGCLAWLRILGAALAAMDRV